ncbi:MAG: hypothetical protein KKH34_01575, partial [Candidatus Omnitrophica bacterium]|nr:hypothetical protein [Candidatus Omnitrophota bacterium]
TRKAIFARYIGDTDKAEEIAEKIPTEDKADKIREQIQKTIDAWFANIKEIRLSVEVEPAGFWGRLTNIFHKVNLERVELKWSPEYISLESGLTARVSIPITLYDPENAAKKQELILEQQILDAETRGYIEELKTQQFLVRKQYDLRNETIAELTKRDKDMHDALLAAIYNYNSVVKGGERDLWSKAGQARGDLYAKIELTLDNQRSWARFFINEKVLQMHNIQQDAEKSRAPPFVLNAANLASVFEIIRSQNISLEVALMRLQQAQVLAQKGNSSGKLSVDFSAGFNIETGEFGFFPSISGRINTAKDAKGKKLQAKLNNRQIQLLLAIANLKEQFINALFKYVIFDEALKKHESKVTILDAGQLTEAKLERGRSIVVLNYLLGRPLDAPPDIEISLGDMGKIIKGVFNNGQDIAQERADGLMLENQIRILEGKMEILKNGGSRNFNIPVYLFLTPEPLTMLGIWAGIETVKWFIGYMDNTKELETGQLIAKMQEDIKSKKAEIALKKSNLGLQQQVTRVVLSEEALKDNDLSKYLDELIRAFRLGVSDAQEQGKSSGREQSYTAQTILDRARAYDTDSIIAYLNYKFAQTDSTFRVRRYFEGAAAPYRDAGQWFKKGEKPVTTAVVEIISEYSDMSWLENYKRQRLEKESKKMLWQAAQLNARLKAAGFLYELGAIDEVKESTVYVKQRRDLDKRRVQVVRELKALLGMNPEDVLVVDGLAEFIQRQKPQRVEGAQISDSFSRNILLSSQIRILSNDVEKAKALIKSLLSDFDFKARAVIGAKFGEDANGGEVKDIVLGITFETPDASVIANNIRPYVTNLKISEREKAQAVVRLSLELNQLLAELSGYGERLQASANLFYTFRQDYEAKLERGDEYETSASRAKMIEAMNSYLDDLFGFYSTFEELKILLSCVGMDITQFTQENAQGPRVKKVQAEQPRQLSAEFVKAWKKIQEDVKQRDKEWNAFWQEIVKAAPQDRNRDIIQLSELSKGWFGKYDSLATDVIEEKDIEQRLRSFVAEELLPVYERALLIINNEKLDKELRKKIAQSIGIEDLFTYSVLKEKEYSREAIIDIFGDTVLKNIADNYAGFLDKNFRGLSGGLSEGKKKEFKEPFEALRSHLRFRPAYKRHAEIKENEICVLASQKIGQWLEVKVAEARALPVDEDTLTRLLQEKKIDTPPLLYTNAQKWRVGNAEKQFVAEITKDGKKELVYRGDLAVIVVPLVIGDNIPHEEYKTIKDFEARYPKNKCSWYAFALPGEEADSLGRGRKLNEKQIRILAKQCKHFQTWVKVGDAEYPVLFNPGLLGEEIDKARKFITAETDTAQVLARAEFAAEMAVDQYGNTSGKEKRLYTKAELVDKRDKDGAAELDENRIPIVVLRYTDIEGKQQERRVSFYVLAGDGKTYVKVDPGKYPDYDFMVIDDTVKNNDPYTGNRIIFGENAIRRKIALNVLGELYLRTQIKKAGQSLIDAKRWKGFEKMLPVFSGLTSEQAVGVLRVIFNAAVTAQSITNAPSKEDVSLIFRKKLLDMDKVLSELNIPSSEQEKSRVIIESNLADSAAMTEKLNKLEGVKLRQEQIKAALEKGIERFITLVRKAKEIKDDKELNDYIKKETSFNKDSEIAAIRLFLGLIDNTASILGGKRDDRGLLYDSFAYFSGGEINILSILAKYALPGEYAFLGRGEFGAEGFNRLLTPFGLTIDIFDLFSIDSYEDINPDLLRLYIFGYPLFADQSRIQQYIDARENNFAVEVSSGGKITRVYQTKEEYEKIKLKRVAVIKLEAVGVDWPLFVNAQTGGVILLGLPAFGEEFNRLRTELDNHFKAQKITVGEGGYMENSSREPEQITEGRISSKEKISVDDIVNFIINFRNSDTFLNPSFFYLPGERGLHHKRNLSYTYDIGLSYHLLDAANERVLSGAQADYLEKTGNIRMFAADMEKKKSELLGVANAIDSASIAGRILEEVSDSGPVAYLIKVFLNEYRNSNEQRYLDAAVRLIGALETRIDKDGGLFKGRTHGLIKSGEENIDILSAYREADKLYQTDKDKFKVLKPYSRRFSDIADWFCSNLYDKEKGYFVRGLDAEGKKDGVFATDVNALAIIGLGPQEINNRLGKGAADRIWQQTQKQARVENISVSRPDNKIVTAALLYDCTNAEQRVLLNREPVGFLEISGQMALGCLVMAEYYLQAGNTAAQAEQISRYKTILEGLDKLAVNISGRGAVYPYATRSGIKAFADDGENIPDAIGSIAATAWIGFAKAGFNPLSGKFVSPEIASAAGISVPKEGVPAKISERTPRFTERNRLEDENESAIFREETMDLRSTVEVGKSAVKKAEDRLDQLQDGKGDDRLLYFNKDTYNYGYYQASTHTFRKVTIKVSHDKIIQDIAKRERERDALKQQPLLAAQGGIVIYNSDGSIREVLAGEEVFRKHFNYILDTYNNLQQNEIARRGWIYSDEVTAKDGQKEDVFIAVKFPVKDRFVFRSVNRSSGKEEVRIYEFGQLNKIIAESFITELEYNAEGVETTAHIYENLSESADENARKGAEVKIAWTIAFDVSDLKHPIGVKKVRSLDSGYERIEVYRDYKLPVMTIDEKYITQIEYDDEGHVLHSKSWINKSGSLDNPQYDKDKPAFIAERLYYDEATKYVAVRIKDVNRKKEQIVIRDPEGRLMVGYYGRIDEKKQGANIVQVKDAKQQTVFSFDAKNFVIDKETVYYYKYDTALEKYGVSREQMRYLGARGIAMVGETYVYDSQKGRQGGSVGSSVVKKISKDSYFDAHGNILLQMYGPKQKLVWQQLVDNKGRKIVDYYGHLEGERFVREKASFSFYTVRHLEEFKANNAALYEQLKNELKSLNIDIESKEYRQRLNSLGKIDVALLGATFSYDNNTHRSQDLLSFSAVKPQPDGRYIDDAGRVLVLGKDFQKKNVNEFLIDSEGRVAVKYSGRFDYKVKKFIREKQTFFYYSYEDKARIEKEYGINLDKNNKDRFETEYGIDLTKKQEMKVLGLYGVAMVGETFTYNNETGKIGGLVANSFLKKFENGEYVDKDGNILVQMTNANQHMSRQDVIDNLGRTIIRYLGKLDLLTNEFERALVARFFYSTQQLESFKEESPELYNQLIEEYKKLGLDIENPDFQEALNRYGKIGVGLIGATYIYSPQKEAVTLTAVSLIKEIGKESYQDARGRTRVRGIYIDNTGDVLVEMKNVLNNLHWQEQIDNDGKIRVKFDGILDENGNFIRNQKTYYFYDYDSFSAFRDAHPELRKELDEWQSKLPKLNNINLRQVMDELGRCGIGMVGFTLLYNEKNQQVVDELLEIRNAVQQADKKALKTIVSAKFSVLKDSIDKLAIPEVMAIFNALIEKEKQGTLSSAQVSSDINEIINKLNEPLSFSFLNTHESSVAMKVAENFVNQFFDVGKDRQAAAALPGLTNHIADFMSASSPDEEQAALTALKNKLLGLDSKLQKSVDDVRADVKKSIAKTLQDLKDKVKKGAGLVADSLGLTLEERKAVLGDIQKALEGIMMKTPEQEKEVIENLVKTLRQKIAITLDEAKLRAAINNISLQSPLTSALLNYNQSPHEILPSHYFKDNGEISVQMVRFKQKLTWEEIKDNFGRPVTVYEWGRVNAGPLQRTKATDYYYTYKDEFAALSGNYYRADDKRFAHLAGDKERIKEAMRAEMEKTMNSMGKLGFALVGKTYLLDREGKRGEKPIASSIVKEIQPEAKGLFQRYFNDKGEMLIQLKNERTKLVWQEVKDAHGRVIYAYDGKMVNGVFKRTKVTRFYYTMDDFKDWNGFFNFIFRKMGEDWEKLGYTKEQMEVEIKNALERLGKYDIATLGSTYRYDPNCAYGINPDFKKGESNLLAISILQKFNPDEYGSIVDKGETDYINDQGYIKPLIYDVKTHLVWMGIKDNKGRIRYKYDGYETAPGKFSWVWVSRINYDWPEDKENLGAIGIAYGSNTYLYKNYLDIDSVAAQLSALAVDFAADSDLKGRLSDVLKVYFEKAVQRDKVVEKLIKQLNTMSAAGLSKQKLIAGLSSEYKIILREFASRYLVSIAMNLRQTTDRVTELALAYNEGDGQFFLKLDNLLKKYFPIAKHRDEVREALKNAVDNEGKKKLDKKDLQGALSDAISGVLINYTAFHIDHGFGKVTTSQIVSFDKEGKVFIDEKGNVIFHMYQKKRNLDYQEVKDNQGRIRILFDGKVTVNVPESQDQERYKHFKRDIMTFSYFEDEELDLISVSNRGEAAFYLSKEEIIKHLTQMKADDVSVILNRHKEVLKPGQLTAYEKEITDCGGLSTLAENLRLAINKTIVVFRDKHQFASPDVIADMIYEDKQQPGYKLSGLSRETLAVLCGGLIGESISESWLIPFDETKESKIDRYFNVSGDIQYEAVEHWKSEVTKNGELLLTKADVHYRRTKDNLGRVIKHTWGYWNNFKDFMSIMQLQAKYQTRYGKFSIADITTAFLTERGWTLFNYSKAVNLDTKTGAVDYAVVKTEIENESEEDSEKLEQQFESYWKLYRIPLSREKMIERIKAKAGCEQAKAKELVERICREVYQDGGFDSEDELIAFFKENNIPLDTRDDDDREFIDTFYEKLKHRLATIAVEPVETGSVSSRPKI